MFRLLPVLCATLLAAPAWAFDSEPNPPVPPDERRTLAPNALFVTAGTLLFRSAITLNYERRLTTFKRGFFTDLRLRVAGGPYYDLDWFGPASVGPTGSIALAFVGGRHLDLGIGYSVGTGGTLKSGSLHLPVMSVGYRYQEPDSNLLFRVGLGLPDGLYMSLGTVF